jgi:hypothetical protein
MSTADGACGRTVGYIHKLTPEYAVEEMQLASEAHQKLISVEVEDIHNKDSVLPE